MTVGEWLKNAMDVLNHSGVPDVRSDARLIISDVLETPLDRVFMKTRDELSPGQLRLLEDQLRFRIQRKPLQYVQSKAFFMDYEFYVDDRVLIPRQDTELLCELAVNLVGNGKKNVWDVCTGSGAIAVAIALKCPNAQVYASDISTDALTVAKMNAKRLGANVIFAAGDFLDAFDLRFDVITCNPPYLSDLDMSNMQREVCFEPRMALYGGNDGLDFYKRAVKELPSRLSNGGRALFEIGLGQTKDISSLCETVKVYKDLNGIDRVIEFGGFYAGQ